MMEFLYPVQELRSEPGARDNTFLLTNGLGGYASVNALFGVSRCDQGVLVAAVKAPNQRIGMVHRLRDALIFPDQEAVLTGQRFADGTPQEDGCRYLSCFRVSPLPSWEYAVRGVHVTRTCCMRQGENTAAVLYEIRNTTGEECTLRLTPYLKFAPKEDALQQPRTFTLREHTVTWEELSMQILTDGTLEQIPAHWQLLDYPEDAKDGRPAAGLAGACCRIEKTVAPGERTTLEVVFTTQDQAPSGWELLEESKARWAELEKGCACQDPVARQLAIAADAYIARRDSTGGKTVLAGYPLFSDWGRDTMIALPGCCFATGRMEDAKSILRTFLAYEKDGLVPNLFPEGTAAPMYNTVDAALLLIDCVWQYVQATKDWAFAWEALPVMERIVSCYRRGTHHGIGMDEDGLIFAGQGLDQVTWMDVCVQGILPTPRHGKPVEINAYWYNALRILAAFSETLGFDGQEYLELAEQVQYAFTEKFYIPEKGYLKDVLSDTDADTQIRCNQIWALSMSFTMLRPEQERKVLQTVKRHLYTPFGLRTLSPEDPQYQPFYGGQQLKRDLAYHQGTTWVFPLGAYYRAVLKVGDNGPEAVAEVREGLENLPAMLRQGCAGQLPEIYDGDHPSQGKGCFAQAWSVGEMLRVYEAIHRIEKETER